MSSKDDIINVIMRITGGTNTKEFTKSDILRELGRKRSNETIDKALGELLNEGFIIVKRRAGRAIYYTLSGKVEKQTEEEKIVSPSDNDTLNGIRQLFDEYFTKYFGRPKTYEDLDKVYDIIKDDIGYAQIKDLREQLGMSLEQFMSIFRDYILQHYELISGGKEGFVQRGVLYGIIRRKR